MTQTGLKTRTVNGLKCEFSKMSNRDKSKLYRGMITSLAGADLDTKITDGNKVDAAAISQAMTMFEDDEKFEKMRDLMFQHIMVDGVVIGENYEAVLDKHGFMLELPLFQTGIEVYLGEALTAAAEKESGKQQAENQTSKNSTETG